MARARVVAQQRPGGKAGGGSSKPCRVTLATLVARVVKALAWWGSYYEYQSYEKKFDSGYGYNF